MGSAVGRLVLRSIGVAGQSIGVVLVAWLLIFGVAGDGWSLSGMGFGVVELGVVGWTLPGLGWLGMGGGSVSGAVSSLRSMGLELNPKGLGLPNGCAGRVGGCFGYFADGIGSSAGMYFLRNLRFLRVTLLEPSTLTTYWSNCFTSIMQPVLSHLRG